MHTTRTIPGLVATARTTKRACGWPSLIVAALVAVSVAGSRVAAQPAANAPAARAQQVDAIFARVDATSSPGCTVGVGVKGQRVLERGYGMADLEHDTVLRPDAIVEAGSVSKQFTAAAVLLLARDGKLSLDDPVRTHIPELPEYGVPLTIRHMLTHTAGLRDWGTMADLGGWPRTRRAHTHAHALQIMARQTALNFTPGTDWSYSNSGYNLAAILVSRVSGMSFADFTRTRIFEPLGMRDTSWRDDHRRIVRRRAMAYADARGTFTTLMPFEDVHGNGGLLTTVGDLLTWNQNFVTHVVGDAAFVAEQERTAVLSSGVDTGYGLGLYVGSAGGRREVYHSGATAGYRAFLVRYPAEQLSVAVLCNVTSANAERLARQVADLYLDAPPAPVPGASVTLAPDVARARAGIYRQVDGPQVLVLNEADGALRVSDGPVLSAVSPTAMRLGNATVEFGADGVATRARVSGASIKPRTYERVPRATPTAADLRAFAGRYRSDEADVSIEVVVENGALVVMRAPADTMPLTPLYADAFASDLGTIRFDRGPRGAVTALRVSTDRAWDVAFVRQ